MSDIIQLHCTKCGSETFKTAGEVKTIDDLHDTVCSQCGEAFSEDDLRKQAREIAARVIRETLKDVKGIEFS